MALLAISYPQLKKSDYDWIQNIRSEHDRDNYKAIEPHFTFVFPSRRFEKSRLINHIKDTVRGLPEIKFTFRCATVHHTPVHKSYYTFLVPDEGFSGMVRLHDAIYTGFMTDFLNLDAPYIPHITIGISDASFVCKKLADKINAENIEIVGRIGNIEIIDLDDGVITPIEKISLMPIRSS